MIEWGSGYYLWRPSTRSLSHQRLLKKMERKKLIIYSMGNFISNQRIETMTGVDNAKWTERGVLMDVTVKKKGGKQLLTQLKLIQLGSIEHQREPFHQKDIPYIIIKPIS